MDCLVVRLGATEFPNAATYSIRSQPAARWHGRIKELADTVRQNFSDGIQVVLLGSSLGMAERLRDFLHEYDIPFRLEFGEQPIKASDSPLAPLVGIGRLSAGVSLPDVLAREGVHPETPRVPYTPGWELVGTVDQLGEGGLEARAASPEEAVRGVDIVLTATNSSVPVVGFVEPESAEKAVPPKIETSDRRPGNRVTTRSIASMATVYAIHQRAAAGSPRVKPRFMTRSPETNVRMSVRMAKYGPRSRRARRPTGTARSACPAW